MSPTSDQSVPVAFDSVEVLIEPRRAFEQSRPSPGMERKRKSSNVDQAEEDHPVPEEPGELERLCSGPG
jgi:hypothetical protein